MGSEIQAGGDPETLLVRAYGEACSGKASKARPSKHDDVPASFPTAGTFSSVVSAVHQNLHDTLYHSNKPRMQVCLHPHLFLQVTWHMKQHRVPPLLKAYAGCLYPRRA